MSLKAQLLEDMKTAMKARDSVRLGVIRFLLSDLKNYEIDHGEQDDAGIQQLITRQVKQVREAISEFEKGGRGELVEEERAKEKVLESYLPQQMREEELEAIVRELAAANGELGMGQLIGAVKAKVGMMAEGARVAEMVKRVKTA